MSKMNKIIKLKLSGDVELNQKTPGAQKGMSVIPKKLLKLVS